MAESVKKVMSDIFGDENGNKADCSQLEKMEAEGRYVEEIYGV